MKQVKKSQSKNKSVKWNPTDRQQIFVEEYLRGWNATEAARKAGYLSPLKQGWRMMQHPEIKKLIVQRMAEISMQTDEVLLRLTQQARSNVGDFIVVQQHIDPKTGKPIQEFTIDMDKVIISGHLIKKLSYNARGKPTIELYDAQNALALIGKTYGMFIDKLEADTTEHVPVQVYIPDNGRPDTELPLQDDADVSTDD